jgi:hypothetical protein
MGLFRKDDTKADAKPDAAKGKEIQELGRGETGADASTAPYAGDDERGVQILVRGEREIDALVTLGVATSGYNPAA